MVSSSSLNFCISATHLQDRDAQFNSIQLSNFIYLVVFMLFLSGYSKEFEVKVGIHQGSVLSPSVPSKILVSA